MHTTHVCTYKMDFDLSIAKSISHYTGCTIAVSVRTVTKFGDYRLLWAGVKTAEANNYAAGWLPTKCERDEYLRDKNWTNAIKDSNFNQFVAAVSWCMPNCLVSSWLSCLVPVQPLKVSVVEFNFVTNLVFVSNLTIFYTCCIIENRFCFGLQTRVFNIISKIPC